MERCSGNRAQTLRPGHSRFRLRPYKVHEHEPSFAMTLHVKHIARSGHRQHHAFFAVGRRCHGGIIPRVTYPVNLNPSVEHGLAVYCQRRLLRANEMKAPASAMNLRQLSGDFQSMPTYPSIVRGRMAWRL